MTKVYILFYDYNQGDREEWNTFYTPCEVFATEAARQERIDLITKADSMIEFHTLDQEVYTNADFELSHIIDPFPNGS